MDKQLLINKYVQGTLTAEEERELDLLRTEDSTVESEIDELENLSNGIRLNHLEDKMKMLKKLDERAKGRIIPLFDSRALSLAASFVILVAAGLWFYNQQNSPYALYNEYYEILPAREISRGNQVIQKDFLDAVTIYNQRDFKAAATALENIDVPRAAFYRGISLMELKQFQKAIEAFNIYSKNEDPNPLPSHYYIGLCYLKLKDMENAIRFFERVKESDTYYFDKAEALLDQL